MRRKILMRRITHFKAGLPSFLIFTFLSSAIIIGGAGLNTALAASQQTVGPKEAPIEQKVNDPYEHFNRGIFKFNDRLYFDVIKPTAQAYSVFPAGFRRAVRNGFHNLVFPSRFINFVLQGKAEKAGNEMTRFVINSTLGIGGLFDVAQKHFGLQNYEADFGQTLGIWGVKPGAFLMVPVIGPSDQRDLVGYVVDSAMDPLFWFPAAWWVSVTANTGEYINKASLKIGEYEALKKASLDPYIAMRDAYIQYRAHVVSK